MHNLSFPRASFAYVNMLAFRGHFSTLCSYTSYGARCLSGAASDTASHPLFSPRRATRPSGEWVGGIVLAAYV